MEKKHGVTANTFTRFIIDAGAVYKNWGESSEVLLGATRGGNSFKIETELRQMEVDGAIGPVKGGKRITNVVATITANFVEVSKALFLLANPAATAADYPATGTKTHDLISRAADLATTDYITNIAIVGMSTYSSTNFVVVKLLNVLADGNIEIGFNDKDESVLPVTFTAHFDPSLLSQEPWQIYNPVIG
jgi:hypothetical protein